MNGVERIVADDRRVIVAHACGAIAAVALLVVRQIVDVACVAAAERNAPFERSVLPRCRICRSVRPDFVGRVVVRMREEAFAAVMYPPGSRTGRKPPPALRQ